MVGWFLWVQKQCVSGTGPVTGVLGGLLYWALSWRGARTMYLQHTYLGRGDPKLSVYRAPKFLSLALLWIPVAGEQQARKGYCLHALLIWLTRCKCSAAGWKRITMKWAWSDPAECFSHSFAKSGTACLPGSSLPPSC